MAVEHVLIVDDEPAIREMLAAVLEEEGYRCSVASGYESALEIVSSHPIDLVLLDLVMPQRSGMELFHAVRSAHPEVAVVFLTAATDPSMVGEAMVSGASGYLVKPVSLIEMERVVSLALEERRADRLPVASPQKRYG